MSQRSFVGIKMIHVEQRCYCFLYWLCSCCRHQPSSCSRLFSTVTEKNPINCLKNVSASNSDSNNLITWPRQKSCLINLLLSLRRFCQCFVIISVEFEWRNEIRTNHQIRSAVQRLVYRNCHSTKRKIEWKIVFWLRIIAHKHTQFVRQPHFYLLAFCCSFPARNWLLLNSQITRNRHTVMILSLGFFLYFATTAVYVIRFSHFCFFILVFSLSFACSTTAFTWCRDRFLLLKSSKWANVHSFDSQIRKRQCVTITLTNREISRFRLVFSWTWATFQQHVCQFLLLYNHTNTDTKITYRCCSFFIVDVVCRQSTSDFRHGTFTSKCVRFTRHDFLLLYICSFLFFYIDSNGKII